MDPAGPSQKITPPHNGPPTNQQTTQRLFQILARLARVYLIKRMEYRPADVERQPSLFFFLVFVEEGSSIKSSTRTRKYSFKNVSPSPHNYTPLQGLERYFNIDSRQLRPPFFVASMQGKYPVIFLLQADAYLLQIGLQEDLCPGYGVLAPSL